jgi:hypothetical protein
VGEKMRLRRNIAISYSAASGILEVVMAELTFPPPFGLGLVIVIIDVVLAFSATPDR